MRIASILLQKGAGFATLRAVKTYRYNRTDFQPLPAKLEHMDIRLSFIDGRVEGSSVQRITARAPLDTVTLNARDIELRSVAWLDDRTGGASPLAYDYQRERHLLVVTLPERVEPGRTFTVRAEASCIPSDNVLEGIYKDTTPPGCPQQYMSQCQQWGFQRILPVFDDCTAKCTMTTSIEADARYTHLISNGNVSRLHNPDGKPALKPGEPSRKVITYVNPSPMAPYLFLVCVGTWDMLEDEVVYPSGRRVRLEYLVPPGQKQGAVVPMKILKESVLWVARTQGYEYDREVYRTICMEKSNFGGMENVGNTTIVTSAALVDEFISDRRLEYAHGVIVHEFEHNQCGSDVTMETPFDMWLNEAFTVDVERQFRMTQFDPACVRLDELDDMRAPIGGPLAIEDGGHMGNIVREGFNDPDELVDGLTYVKAAEVIRMLRLVIGPEKFREGKDLYFSRYKGGNANTDQFFACFEEVSRRDLTQFKREWLHTIGYPKVEGRYAYDAIARRLQISFTQTRTGAGGLFHVPVELAAVDEDGREIPDASGIVEISAAGGELMVENAPRPAFVSFNRDCSFYGTFTDASATPETLRLQIRRDPGTVNRVEAMRQLTDIERINLIRNPAAPVSAEWLDVYESLARDASLPPGLKAYLLRLDEQSLDRRYLPCYRERYAARGALLKAAAARCMDELTAAYNEANRVKWTAADPKAGLEERRLKGVILRTLIEADTPAVHALAEDLFRASAGLSDKLMALACINISSHPRRRDLMEEAYRLWKDRLPAYSGYLTLIGGGIHDDVFDRLAEEEQRDTFRIHHPNHSRGLYLSMAGNNKMLWTGRGIRWVADTAVKLAPINENTAIRLVGCFQQVHNLAADLKPEVIAALESILARIPAGSAPSVIGRVTAYLGGNKEPTHE